MAVIGIIARLRLLCLRQIDVQGGAEQISVDAGVLELNSAGTALQFRGNAIAASAIQDDSVTTAKIEDGAVTPAKTINTVAITANDDGLTDAIIPDTATHVTVTSSASTKIVTLPTPTPGRQLTVDVGSNGFKLRSTAPASIAINGGTGASAVSAVAASSTIFLTCVSATAWKAIFLDADADVAKLPAAA